MKAILFLMVILGGMIVAVWQFGGYATLDPTQQGKDAKAAIKPGMTWKQVIDQTTEPRKFCMTLRKTKMVGGEEVEFDKPSVPMDFDIEGFTKAFNDDEYLWGFRFNYSYSSSVAFAVEFDPSGNVIYVLDMMTMADLFQMPKD